MLVINLALSDLIFSAVNGFPLLTISAFNRKWMWGNSACVFYGFIGGLFGLMSINTLAAISIDRYYNIAEPLKAAQFMTRRKAFMMIVCVWIWSLIWSVPPIFGWGGYIPEGFQTSCTFDYLSTEPHMRGFMVAMYIGDFAVPLTIIIVCYVLIWKAIRKHDREMLQMAKKMKVDDIRANQEKTKADVRIAKIAMIIIFLYCLSWSPYATVALIAQFGPTQWVTPYVSEFNVMLAKAAAMHNPVVYAFSHPRFRDALNKRVPWLMCCCDVKTPTSPSASNTRATGRTKQGASRQVSNDSYYDGGNDSDVSSCISHVDNIEMRPNLSETSFSRHARKGAGGSPVGGSESGDIVRELIHALVSVTNRQQSSPAQFPQQNNLQNTGGAGQGVYVVENGNKIEISSYLAQLVASGGIGVDGVKSKENTKNIPAANKTEKDNKADDSSKKDAKADEASSVSKISYTNPAYVNDGCEEQNKPKEHNDGHV